MKTGLSIKLSFVLFADFPATLTFARSIQFTLHQKRLKLSQRTMYMQAIILNLPTKAVTWLECVCTQVILSVFVINSSCMT